VTICTLCQSCFRATKLTGYECSSTSN